MLAIIDVLIAVVITQIVIFSIVMTLTSGMIPAKVIWMRCFMATLFIFVSVLLFAILKALAIPAIIILLLFLVNSKRKNRNDIQK